MHWQELALGSLPLQATKDWTGILKAQVSSAFLQGSWLVDPCGPSQDLLGWAKCGSTRRQASSHLKQQLGAGDQPGQKEKAAELLVCVSGRGDRVGGALAALQGRISQSAHRLPVLGAGPRGCTPVALGKAQ